MVIEQSAPTLDGHALRIIHSQANTLKRNPVFHGRLVGDIAGDLIGHVLEKRAMFDPARQAWPAFVRVVVENHGVSLIRKQSTRMETALRRTTISLDKTVGFDDGNPVTIADAMSDGREPLDERVARSVDFAAVLTALPEKMKWVAEQLMADRSQEDIAREMDMPLTTFRRKIIGQLQAAFKDLKHSGCAHP